MNFFAKAVINGFALSLGAALFKKVAKELGLETETKKADEEVGQREAATDPPTDSSRSTPIH